MTRSPERYALSDGNGNEIRVAIVTGGASGMGEACVARLARDGFSVILADLDPKKSLLVSERILSEDPDSDIHPFECDVSDPDQVARMFTAAREIAPPTVLVNAAGILHRTRFCDITLQEWEESLRVNLTSAMLCSQAVIPSMIRAGWGRIVNFSSTAGKSVSTLGGAHYTASKAGLLGLTRAVAKEVAGQGITVNAVCPGLIDTPMVTQTLSMEQISGYAASFPVGRLGTPDEVAALVGFLVSSEAAYVNGASIDINGADLLI